MTFHIGPNEKMRSRAMAISAFFCFSLVTGCACRRGGRHRIGGVFLYLGKQRLPRATNIRFRLDSAFVPCCRDRDERISPPPEKAASTFGKTVAYRTLLVEVRFSQEPIHRQRREIPPTVRERGNNVSSFLSCQLYIRPNQRFLVIESLKSPSGLLLLIMQGP